MSVMDKDFFEATAQGAGKSHGMNDDRLDLIWRDGISSERSGTGRGICSTVPRIEGLNVSVFCFFSLRLFTMHDTEVLWQFLTFSIWRTSIIIYIFVYYNLIYKAVGLYVVCLCVCQPVCVSVCVSVCLHKPSQTVSSWYFWLGPSQKLDPLPSVVCVSVCLSVRLWGLHREELHRRVTTEAQIEQAVTL